jgi:hypothetical protein
MFATAAMIDASQREWYTARGAFRKFFVGCSLPVALTLATDS